MADVAQEGLMKAGGSHVENGAASDAGIKKCPVCKTTLFDDMDTCYGCMYKFGSSPELEASAGMAAMASAPVEAVADTASITQAASTATASPATTAVLDVPIFSASSAESGCLFNKFLVEFYGFLGDFIADGKVNVN